MKPLSELTEEVKRLTEESKATAENIAQVKKETGETLDQVTALNAKILELQEQINNGVDTSELETAVNALASQSATTLAQAKATNDLIPDATA